MQERKKESNVSACISILSIYLSIYLERDSQAVGRNHRGIYIYIYIYIPHTMGFPTVMLASRDNVNCGQAALVQAVGR